jgi:rhodanese-related sulfurtransferase
MTSEAIPEMNKTSLGLYVMPKEAYAMWQANSEGVHILDVRTFEEYTFVGHLEMAKNIPFVFPKYDPKGPSMPGRPPGCYGEVNPDFVPAVKELFAPTDTILVYCL